MIPSGCLPSAMGLGRVRFVLRIDHPLPVLRSIAPPALTPPNGRRNFPQIRCFSTRRTPCRLPPALGQVGIFIRVVSSLQLGGDAPHDGADWFPCVGLHAQQHEDQRWNILRERLREKVAEYVA